MSKYVFHKRELEKRLDLFELFRLQDKRKLARWTLISTGMLATTLLILVSIHLMLAFQHATLSQKRAFLDRRVRVLQARANSRNNALVGALRAILREMSPEVYIDSVLFEAGSIEIRGGADRIARAVGFCKRLSESAFLSSCQWTHVRHGGHFAFQMRGKTG